MGPSMTLVALSYLAGLVTFLNPCAFPLAPILLSSTWQRHWFGPFALILGLSFAFTIMGFALAVSDRAWGLEIKTLRLISVLLLLGIGLILVSTPLQKILIHRIKPCAQKLRTRLQPYFQELPLEKLAINLLIGGLLGFIWLPCTGPTLAFALTLAKNGTQLKQAGTIMVVYTLGVATPLLLLSYLFKKYLKHKKVLKSKESLGRIWLGYALIFVSFLILTGIDKAVETWLVSHTPPWLLELTTKY